MTEIDEQNAKLEAECDRLRRALDAAYATSELFAAECLRWRRAHADSQPTVVTVCCSCGSDPNVYPETGAELPIVRGALDAQAHAEQRLFATREKCQECERHRVERDVDRRLTRDRIEALTAECERLCATLRMARGELVDGYYHDESCYPIPDIDAALTGER